MFEYCFQNESCCSMAANLSDFVYVGMHPRAVLLAMITIRKSMHGFPFLSYKYGALLDCPSGHRALLLIFGVEDS